MQVRLGAQPSPTWPSFIPYRGSTFPGGDTVGSSGSLAGCRSDWGHTPHTALAPASFLQGQYLPHWVHRWLLGLPGLLQVRLGTSNPTLTHLASFPFFLGSAYKADIGV